MEEIESDARHRRIVYSSGIAKDFQNLDFKKANAGLGRWWPPLDHFRNHAADMNRRTALKRLSASDLTLFDAFFRTHDAGNQKAINLNANVFVQQLYPTLGETQYADDAALDLKLIVLGPNGAEEPLHVSTKIIKGTTYKNWRMGGATISDPISNGQRFASLEDGDLALLRFAGDALPISATMRLISGHGEADRGLYDLLIQELEQQSMVALTDERMSALSQSADVAIQTSLHPFNSHADALARGVAEGEPRTADEDVLDRDKCRRLGKQVIARHFGTLQKAGVIKRVTAIDDRALSGVHFDFRVEDSGGRERLIGVKAVSGPFGAAVRISTHELIAMRDSPQQYDLYCVYGFLEHSARFRIASDLRGFAQRLFPLFASFPDTVIPERFAVKPEILNFGPEAKLEITLAKRAKMPTSSAEEVNSKPEEAPRSNDALAVSDARSLEEYDTNDIMAAFRAGIRVAHDMSEDDLLREVTRRLGFARLGKKIRSDLKGHLRAAIRRQIVARDGQHVVSATSQFGQYEDEFLLKALASVMRPALEYDRDEVVKMMSLYLGFAQPTNAMRDRMKSIFNSAIRRGMLSYRGQQISRMS